MAVCASVLRAENFFLSSEYRSTGTLNSSIKPPHPRHGRGVFGLNAPRQGKEAEPGQGGFTVYTLTSRNSERSDDLV